MKKEYIIPQIKVFALMDEPLLQAASRVPVIEEDIDADAKENPFTGFEDGADALPDDWGVRDFGPWKE